MRKSAAIATVCTIVFVVVIILGLMPGTLNQITSTTARTTTSSSLSTSHTTESYSGVLWPLSALENGSAVCISINSLPDPRCTPGATNSNVTQADIYSTICVSGWTTTVRPPENYTEQLKYKSIQEYGYNDTYVGDYEEDHLIPLELGGSPTSVYNLWAEPHYGNYTSYDKDGLENYLNSQVCDGKLSLVSAQQEISTNWVQTWIMAGKPNGSSASGD